MRKVKVPKAVLYKVSEKFPDIDINLINNILVEFFRALLDELFTSGFANFKYFGKFYVIKRFSSRAGRIVCNLKFRLADCIRRRVRNDEDLLNSDDIPLINVPLDESKVDRSKRIAPQVLKYEQNISKKQVERDLTETVKKLIKDN